MSSRGGGGGGRKGGGGGGGGGGRKAKPNPKRPRQNTGADDHQNSKPAKIQNTPSHHSLPKSEVKATASDVQESHKNVQGDDGKKESKLTADECNKSECVKVRAELLQLKVERNGDKETISKLQKDIGRLTLKLCKKDEAVKGLPMQTTTRNTAVSEEVYVVTGMTPMEFVAKHGGQRNYSKNKVKEDSDKRYEQLPVTNSAQDSMVHPDKDDGSSQDSTAQTEQGAGCAGSWYDDIDSSTSKTGDSLDNHKESGENKTSKKQEFNRAGSGWKTGGKKRDNAQWQDSKEHQSRGRSDSRSQADSWYEDSMSKTGGSLDNHKESGENKTSNKQEFNRAGSDRKTGGKKQQDNAWWRDSKEHQSRGRSASRSQADSWNEDIDPSTNSLDNHKESGENKTSNKQEFNRAGSDWEAGGKKQQAWWQDAKKEHQSRGRSDSRSYQADGQPMKRSRILNEIDGDLFQAPKTASLAHCVAEDMRMGSGIAVTFRQLFQKVDELLDQGARTGEMAVLQDNDRYIYYLVTKPLSSGKPRLENLEQSLKMMRDHMLSNGVRELAMPRIGCGLDRLNWGNVRELLFHIFGEDNVNITVYNYDKEQGEKSQPRSKLIVKHSTCSLVDMQYETARLYLGSEDGAISESLQNLVTKYPILPQYKQYNKHLGDVVRIVCKEEVLYGLIVKRKEDDGWSFTALSKCLNTLSKLIKADKYEYAGIDVFPISGDLNLDCEKLGTVFKFALFRNYLELYFCWPAKYASNYTAGNELM